MQTADWRLCQRSPVRFGLRAMSQSFRLHPVAAHFLYGAEFLTAGYLICYTTPSEVATTVRQGILGGVVSLFDWQRFTDCHSGSKRDWGGIFRTDWKQQTFNLAKNIENAHF